MLTNNGLDCDETPADYEARLKDRVLPVIARWMQVAPEGSGCMRVVCMQEFPVQPLLQQDFFLQLRRNACQPALQMAVSTAWEAQQLVGQCNAVVWDGSSCERPAQVPMGSKALRLILRNILGTFDVMSFHLPFIDSPGGPRYRDGVKEAVGFFQRFSKEPVRGLIAAGDFNVAVDDLKTEAKCSTPLAAQPDSAVFRGRRLSIDACFASGSVHPDREFVGEHESPLVEVEGVWRSSNAEFFGTNDRDTFIEKHVSKTLHHDPQLWRLGDAAVASLGCWPFAEQVKEVSRMFRGSAAKSSGKKRKLNNPLLSAYASESDETSSAESE